jgi:hypothetical protein
MSIAELHGKLSPDEPHGVHEGMEDLLTSDVFGTMLYAGWHPAFHRWLSEAVVAPGANPDTSFDRFLPSSAEATKAFYSFWPSPS